MASKGFRSAVARRGAALGLAVLIVTAVVGSLVLRAPGTATASSTSGYWLAGADGGVFSYGQAGFYGSAGSVPLPRGGSSMLFWGMKRNRSRMAVMQAGSLS